MYTDIKVGYSCNNNCVHCVVAPIKKDLIKRRKIIDSTTEEVKKFIDEAKKRGSNAIVLTGGEVTIRNDFNELVKYTIKNDLLLNIQTNARILSRPEKLDFLTGLPPITFVVAVHGHNDKIHDSITRSSHSFRQTVDAITSLKKYSNAIIHGKLVISKINRDCIVKTVEFLASLGIKKITIAFPHAEDFSKKDFKKVVPKYSALQSCLAETIDYSCAQGIDVMFETIPYCILPDKKDYWKYSLDASYSINGKLNPGFIQATGNSEINDWEKMRKIIKYKGERCMECVFDKVCEGPWNEYIDVFGDDEFIPLNDPDIANRI
jgi:MoaA/NifB/PqqE/SkfB family radical SAM enzyme